jgi:hypothetical protein
MGWKFPYVSSFRSDYGYDFGASFNEEQPAIETAASCGTGLRGRGAKRERADLGNGLCSDLFRTAGPVVPVRPGRRAAGRAGPGLRRPG